jgi:hypothetical protein
MLKLIVFAVMAVLAAVNRFWLTPRLALPPGSEAQCYALFRLTRNTVTEIALGLLVFAVVGALGTLHPFSSSHSIGLQEDRRKSCKSGCSRSHRSLVQSLPRAY